MKLWITLLAVVLPGIFLPLRAAEQCAIQPLNSGSQSPGPWINKDNWLAPENLRFGMQSSEKFMPQLDIKVGVAPVVRRSATRFLELDKIKARDPLDQQQRDIGFLLDTRLYADGFLVVRNGRVMSEQYWNGLTAQQPRLVLDAGRPVLTIIGAIAVAQGKLATYRSVIRYIPSLTGQTGLRKLSIQRLLEEDGQFLWSPKEIDDWKAAGGWKSGANEGGIRAWMNQPSRWERDFSGGIALTDSGPEGDLLAWALAETYRAPLAQIVCENVLSKLRPESPVRWMTDQKGIELSEGLAISLRDYARLGEVLIDARTSRNRSKIPNWLIETVTSSAGGPKDNASDLSGLAKGSEVRYGFVHLGGKPNRVAIIGSHGNSLYIDFDRRLVIAIFAAYPSNRSANMLATLEQIWEKVDLATQPAAKR